MTDPLRADLVLEGGGVLGIAHPGAVTVLQQHGYTFPRIAGTSAGAVVGSIMAAGLPAERLHETFMSIDFRRFRDKSLLDRVPLLGPLASLVTENGLYEGAFAREWLGNQLSDLGVERFRDLRIEDAESSTERDQQYKLVVLVADLTLGEIVRLPWDYHSRYGLDPDDQLVADAVRASLSIPYLFEPVEIVHADGARSTVIDGGLLSTFPIDTFDRTDGVPPRWPTFGVKIIPKLPVDKAKLLPFLAAAKIPPVDFLASLVLTMVVGRDQTYLRKPWVAARTMQVDSGGINPADFGLDDQQKIALNNAGAVAASQFLAHWNWDDYRGRFRST